jgi:predicted outer membrane repeat protein
VNLTTDNGGAQGQQNGQDAGDLRYCVTHAASSDTIIFSRKAFNALTTTIMLKQGEIASSNSVTITNLTGNQITIDANKQSRIFDFTDPQKLGLSETISNLNFTNGNAPGATLGPNPGLGGAIYDEGSLTLVGDTFTGNQANSGLALDGKGGAVYSVASGRANTLTATNTKFNSNQAGSRGGAIATNDNVNLNQCGFTSNSAASGGAVYATGATGKLFQATNRCSFVDNKAITTGAVRDGYGGAIETTEALEVTLATFDTNQSSGVGGAIEYDPISNIDSHMTLTNDTIQNNSSGLGGGVDTLINNNNKGTVSQQIVGCLFYNNNANAKIAKSQLGGGLHIDAITSGTAASNVQISNSTFYDNASQQNGGGIALELNNTGTGNNTATLTSLTVYDNTAANAGGGLWTNLATNGTSTVSLTLGNSIIAGNTLGLVPVTNGPDILVSGAVQGGVAQFVSNGFNLIGIDDDGTGQHQYKQVWTGNDYVGTDNAPKLPSFNPDGLAQNGGQTQTIKLVSPNKDGSPGGGYQQGNPLLAGTTDQRGFNRQKPVSIGAYDPGAQFVPKGKAAMSLNSSANPDTPYQAVTFTVSVSGNNGTPTGTVLFMADTSLLGIATLDSNGYATFTTSALPLGSQTITAVYNGDDNYDSNSASLAQTINPAASSMSLTSSVNPSQPSQAVTFTVTVSGNNGTPTGSVTLYDNNTVLTTLALNANGVATYTTSALANGSHDIEALYSGDSTYAGSMTSLSQTVSASTVVTGSGTIGSSFSGSIINEGPTKLITLTCSGNIGGGLSGTFSFSGTNVYNGGSGSTSGGGDGFVNGVSYHFTGPINYTVSGNAISGTFRFSGTTMDSRLVSGSGTFSGTLNNNSISGAFSGTIAVDVAPISYTNATASVAPSLVGQSVTLTATVTGNTSSTPTGTVQFYDGSTLLGSGTLNSNGVATFTTSTLSGGVHDILAVYSGDSTYPGSIALLSQTVNLNATTTSLTSSANPSPQSQSVTFTVTVAVVDPNAGTPTGTVTFYDGTTPLGTATLTVVNGQVQATFTTAALGFGSHTILAIYSGDSTFADSGGSLDETID